MIIEDMKQAYVSSVAELERCCFSDPWSENSVASELDNPLSLWLVALEKNCVVGYIGSQTVMGETDMMNVAVAPAYRRKGIAEMLVLTLESRLKKLGSHSLTLEVRHSNIAAQKLYEKLGFSQIGCRKNYYRNPKEDGLILRKEWDI